ncbi:MAG TPA: hypothetical protein VLR90_18055, partial [Blastocatellia bacterium]|nr:hypothetical protein [Blastocatellia bacterium]
ERVERERRKDQVKAEDQILAGLTEIYKKDFQVIRQLCHDIEKRAGEVEEGKSSRPLTQGVVEKLSSFRFEYIRMLRAHVLLANSDYKQVKRWLDQESTRIEQAAKDEPSEQVRAVLEQNLKVLRQRAAKARQINELVRVIEARLQVVRNSLQLIQDEVYSMTDVRGINNIVDELLINLEINEEFRSYYNDMLDDSGNILDELGPIEQMSLGSESHKPTHRQNVEEFRQERH